ncbi:MAG TPA: DUF1844 domain-containing protein [Syntrophales bacterium]|nr:DUF1844 domain-containing protein [Syntrophales bacterium]HOX94892.1 DUF1844 domain-containing protein [Syntrophales bacterium]HPI58102.1 DUF1844 domain-containing protein [Syntrophales bacterium]HPN24637.1 DUF1844 domain-containing protein [Syntrophales bacterium]HQM28942.1 DUF1844 domain-containing protein [Syntrophales bacterium]
MEDEKKDKGFTVKDKRRFDESGETKKGADGAQPEPAGPSGPAEDPGQTGATAPQELPEIDFSTFVFSLSTSALFHFGDFPDPVTKSAEKNLPAAKQTIDILGLLKEKTRGNLASEEELLLDNLLFELRMRYVKEMEKK